jgi:hypothetical protein
MLTGPWMITLVLVGVAGFFAAFVMIAKTRGGKPKKAERSERAAIMKQLLALSDVEDTVKGISSQPAVSRGSSPRRKAAAASGSRSRTA